jgi:TP901 family phage tail tape measure protein
MADANLLEIIVRARDQTKAAFASAKKGITATKTAATNLSKNLGGLNKTFSVASGKISGFGTKLKGLMTSAIGPLIGVMGIAAVTMSLKKTVDAFGSFEQAAANASSVTGKTGAAFLETKKHIMAVSKVLGETTVFKASEAADAFYDLASAGYDVANITKTELKPILDLAAASQTDLKATTELVTSTLGQFGMAIQDSKKVADVFVRTIGSSKATMEKLGNSMVYVGPVAHALGRSLEETSATLGVLYNKGFDASMAGTALRGALSRLMNPTAQVEAKLSELGVTVAEVNPETRSMADILDTLTDAGMDTADAMELFGLRAGPAMLALTQNTDDIRGLTLELENAGGAAAIMAEQQLTTFEGKMKLVHSKIEATTLILGERFAPAIVKLSNTITDVIIPAFGGFFDAIAKKINPALDPLREKLDAAFEKMTGGVSLMQRLKDVGVILGSTLRVLADALGWVVEKLTPLWEITGKLQSGIGILADLLRTEEDYTNDLRAAVELLNGAKAELVVLNEKLIIRMSDLAHEIEKANWGMEELNRLESDVIAAKIAHTAIQSELNAALSHGDIATYNEKERELITATELLEKVTAAYNREVMTAAESQIDYGTATDGVIIAYDEVTKSLDEIEEGLETEIRLEEDAALATEKAAGAHLILNDGITGVVKNLKDNLLFDLDLLIYRLGDFIDLIARVGTGIEKGLTFVFPGYKALKESFENIIILEEKLVDETATSMDAVATTISVGMIAAGQSFELFNQYVRETMDTVASVTEESNEIAVKSWEDRVKEIKVQIDIETKNYQFLTDVERAEADKRIIILNEELKTNQDNIDERNRHITSLGDTTKEATKTMEEFSISVGKTTISFKGAAAEVLKNADAYEKLQKAAQTLIDMDWSVFTEFEASLPIIEAGIGDLESSFVGFKDVLEENIDKLENIKESVMGISEIAAPFLDKGFLNGIKAIGDFAGALKNAGSAINDFTSLQDVSIEGAINFSLHVRDMVSALAILEDQMEDLVPSFGEMDSLISDIVDTFIWTGGRKETLAGELNTIALASRQLEKDYKSGIITQDEYFKRRSESVGIATKLIETTMGVGAYGAGYALVYEYQQRYIEGEEDVNDITTDWLNTSLVIEQQMDKQTNSLKAQTGQLAKITEALQPYLEFMRTLNELAALSTLSTDALNNGLNSIKDTLVNLGTALSSFDLKPIMESLFGTKITEGDLIGDFTGGKATGFIDVMEAYKWEFNSLMVYVTRLSSAITGLVSAFDSLAEIGDSVLADQTKLKKVFEDIVSIMSNFSAEMGDAGFADAIAKGMDTMLKSAAPLITYFDANNASVLKFNNTLGLFKTTITHVVGVMDMLKKMSEMVLPSVDELEAGFEKAAEAVSRFDEALLLHVGAREGQWDMEKYSASIFKMVENFAKDWEMLTKGWDDDFKVFEDGVKSITDMITGISSLTDAFQTLADMPLLTSEQIITGFEKIKDTLNEVNEAMLDFAADGLSELVASLTSIEKQWTEWDTKLGDSDETFATMVTGITSLVNAITSLVDVQTKLAEVDLVSDTDWLSFFKNISDQAHEIGEGMARFTVEGGLTSLTNNLGNVKVIWELWLAEMEGGLKTFGDASSSISGLASSVSGLVTAFVSLAKMPLITEEAFNTGMKRMSTNIENFAGALKDNIATIEVALEAVDDAWSDHAKSMEILVPIFKDATTAINTLAGGIMSVVRSFESLKEVEFEKEFATGFRNLIKATNAFATALERNIGGLVDSLDRLVTTYMQNDQEITKLMKSFVIISRNFMIVIGYANALQEAFNGMTAKSETLGEGFDELIEFMNAVIEGVKEIYTTEGADDLARFVTDVGLVVDAMVTLEGKMESTMDTIRTKINTTVNDLKTKLSSLGTIALSSFFWGAAIMTTFVAGLHSMRWLLRAELIGIADLISFYLGVGSNTKLGALSHLTDWPKNLVNTFAEGIKKGTPELSKALSALTLPTEHLHMPAGYGGLLGGGGNTLTMYNTWNIENKADADYAIREIETLLTRRSVI